MIIGKINTENISVVVQGAVDKVNTPLTLKSVRKCFPGAELILSTWEGTDTAGLDCDKVLLNNDPGGWRDERTNFVNNLNRQLVSSLNGIRSAERQYCVKIRSDLYFKSCRFLKYFHDFPQYEPEYRLFKERILFCSYFFKRYLGEAAFEVHPTPFHLSDWFMFGLREDLLKLFDIPLAKEPANTNYLLRHIHDGLQPDMFGASHQYAPEQYILLKCIQKHMEHVPRMNSIMDYTPENICYYERFVASNFIVLNVGQIKLFCQKNGVDPYRKWSKNELMLPMYVWEGLYRFDVFIKDYIKYCDPDFEIPLEAKCRKKVYLLFHKFFEVKR